MRIHATLLLSLLVGCGSPASSSPPATPSVADTTERADWGAAEVVIVADDIEHTFSRHALGATLGADGSASVHRPTAEHALASIVSEVAREPAPGRVDIPERIVEPHITGRRLTVAEAVAAVEAGLRAGHERIELPVTFSEPTEGRVPEGLGLDVVLGEYTTHFSRRGRYRNRGRNVALAASRFAEVILAPGERFSYNEIVGPRTRSAGFRTAPVISEGELRPGMGGGVCQPASTLHAAIFFAGLELVEYRNHSRPSSYIPVGLDATVVYPTQDLVFENPYDFPVVIESIIDEEDHTVRVLGASRPREIDIERLVRRSGYFDVREVEDPDMPAGTRELTQEGSRGRIVDRVRRVTTDDGRTWEEHDRLVYPPTDEIHHIGTGPALPESDDVRAAL